MKLQEHQGRAISIKCRYRTRNQEQATWGNNRAELPSADTNKEPGTGNLREHQSRETKCSYRTRNEEKPAPGTPGQSYKVLVQNQEQATWGNIRAELQSADTEQGTSNRQLQKHQGRATKWRYKTMKEEQGTSIRDTTVIVVKGQ